MFEVKSPKSIKVRFEFYGLRALLDFASFSKLTPNYVFNRTLETRTLLESLLGTFFAEIFNHQFN